MAFPALPQSWQLRSRSLELPHHNSSLQRPLVMGIVNVTPDSFSDGGRHTTVEQAVQHGLKLDLISQMCLMKRRLCPEYYLLLLVKHKISLLGALPLLPPPMCVCVCVF